MTLYLSDRIQVKCSVRKGHTASGTVSITWTKDADVNQHIVMIRNDKTGFVENFYARDVVKVLKRSPQKKSAEWLS